MNFKERVLYYLGQPINEVTKETFETDDITAIVRRVGINPYIDTPTGRLVTEEDIVKFLSTYKKKLGASYEKVLSLLLAKIPQKSNVANKNYR